MTASLSSNEHGKAFVRFKSDQQVLKSRWARYGACTGLGPGVMYQTSAKKQIELATEVCGQCSVRQECLELALLGEETEGVWGGTTEAERKSLIRTLYDLIDPKEFWDDSLMEIISAVAADYLALNAQ